MEIEFRFGPKDGKRKFLPLGRSSDTIIIEYRKNDYLYRRTSRIAISGAVIYQFVSLLESVSKAG